MSDAKKKDPRPTTAPEPAAPAPNGTADKPQVATPDAIKLKKICRVLSFLDGHRTSGPEHPVTSTIRPATARTQKIIAHGRATVLNAGKEPMPADEEEVIGIKLWVWTEHDLVRWYDAAWDQQLFEAQNNAQHLTWEEAMEATWPESRVA